MSIIHDIRVRMNPLGDWNLIMSSFGFVTIGQSPRTDVLKSMLPDLDERSLLQAGALDHLDRSTIVDLRPGESESPLVTRLRDGSEVVVGKQRLLPHLRQAVNEVAACGANSVVVLCTGEFPELSATMPVIYPDRILRALIDAVLRSGTLGVVMPHADQRDTMMKKWQSPERNALSAVASPYSSAHDLHTVGPELARAGADMILLDCMGFDEAMRSSVSAGTSVPVLLANRLVGRVLEELMASTAAAPGPVHS